MRVFAGPNGSGKSTSIKIVREYRENGHPINFGIYVNADDIAVELRQCKFHFASYQLKVTPKEFFQIVQASGLLGTHFPADLFRSCYTLRANKFSLLKLEYVEQVAQILADFIRKKLLSQKKKFSFETVFSHPSKLEIMREAMAQGYKVYLYFVATESPEMNKERVQIRKAQGGHDVPPDKIVSRYYRSLEQLHDAAQLAYRAYFFDNSGKEAVLFAQFKKKRYRKAWDINIDKMPSWFFDYYVAKTTQL